MSETTPVEGAATPVDGNIRVYLMSSAETGFADFLEMPVGSTIADLWASKMGAQDASKYVIRIARGDASPEGRLPADYKLENGDRITVTPHKVAGAL